MEFYKYVVAFFVTLGESLLFVLSGIVDHHCFILSFHKIFTNFILNLQR